MRTPIASLGKVAFIEHLTSWATSDLICGVGDDAAVIDRGKTLETVAEASMLEGVDFDLSYFPLEHLGQKIITRAVSNIYAMNAVARYVTVNVGLSARFSVEEATALYSGIEAACSRYDVSLIGGNTSSSLTGLMLTATALGEVSGDRLTLRSGADVGDLICTTGTLGAAYMGLKLLDREKRVGAKADREIFTRHRAILAAALNPTARLDIVELLAEYDIVPTSMIDLTSGLASGLLHLCHKSQVGARVYLEKLPINGAVREMADEMNTDPLVAILNGGEDYELLFTASVAHHKDLGTMPDINVIGHIVDQNQGAMLVPPGDGAEIRITSPDFTSDEKTENE
ncbi:MAG: thiamine-phosphate kinase [Mucinivorans sp.]